MNSIIEIRDKDYDAYKFRAWYAFLATVVFVIFEIVCMVTYIKVFAKLNGSVEMNGWIEMTVEKCGRCSEYGTLLNSVY